MEKKVYIKDTGFDPIYRGVSPGFYTRTRVLPSLLIFSGLFVFTTQVMLPLLVFKTQDENISIIDNATVLGRAAGFYNYKFGELERNSDQTQTLGFKTEMGDGSTTLLQGEYIPNSKQQAEHAVTENIPAYFYLTIPKLSINKAKVETNAASLNPVSALGHYPGTSLPGSVGNTFIFGHSVLPWFFNPQNYKTIFSTLSKLGPGDVFTINFNNEDYKYVVESKEELIPDKVKPLAEIKPKYLNESTVTLMTCSPAGTKLKRLLVYAVLEK